MKKIVLLCAGGNSTSLLMNIMKSYAESIGFEMEIGAYGVHEAAEAGKGADIILLGPQVRFNLEEVKKVCPGIQVEAMNMMDYGTMNGEKIVKHVIEVVGK